MSHSDKWQNQESNLDNLTSEHRLWNLCCPCCPGAVLLVPWGSGSLYFSGKKDELWSEVSYPPAFPYQKPVDNSLWDCGDRGSSSDSCWSQGSAALILDISESSWHPSVKYLTPEILHLLPPHLLGPFPLSSKTYTEIPQPLEITHLGRSVVSLTEPQTHSSASFPTKLSPTQCPNTPRMLVKPRLGSTWCRLEALSPSMPQPHLMWGLSLPSFTDGEVNQSIHVGARIWLQGCQTAESTFSLLG